MKYKGYLGKGIEEQGQKYIAKLFIREGILQYLSNLYLIGGIKLGVKNRLLEIRLQRGFKFQKDFAEFLELGQYQYNRYERNEHQPTLEVILKICSKEKLDMDPRELFYLE